MKGAREVTFRTYRDGDGPEIVRLLCRVFGQWPMFDLSCSAQDYWQWKYLRAEGARPVIALAEARSEIVGCFHLICRQAAVKGKDYDVCNGADLAMDPSIQERRLSTELVFFGFHQKVPNQLAMSYSETHVPKLIKRYRELLIELPIERRHLLRIENALRHLEEQHIRWPHIKAGAFWLLKKWHQLRWIGRGYVESSAEIGRAIPSDVEFDEFWQALAPEYDFAVRRDAAYMKWRYLDSRGGDFRLQVARSEGKIAAISVCHIDRKNPDYPVAYVMELLAIPGKEAAAFVLLKDAVDGFDAERINAVHCLVTSSHPLRRVFARLGFVDSLERTPVFATVNESSGLTSTDLQMLTPERVIYSYGDIDTV